MRKVSAAALEQPMKTSDYLMLQLETMQSAFASLADAVVTELDEMRAQASGWQADRQQWLGSMRSLQQGVTDRLLEMERGQLRVASELSSLKVEVQAALGQEAGKMAERAALLDKQLFDVKCDVQYVRNQLCRVEAMASADVPSTVLAQRLADKRTMEEAVDEAVRAVAGGLVVKHVEAQVPGVVREQVQAVMQEVVDRRTEPIRAELTAAAERLRADVGRVVEGVAAVGEDLRSLRDQAKGLEAFASSLDRRVGDLEAEEQINPRPPLSSLAALQEKVEVLGKQQARYTSSMEEVVRALVDDTGRLARTARAHDAAITQHRGHLGETREALARCTAVFSRLLDVPPPVPLATLTASALPPLQQQGGGGGPGGSPAPSAVLSPSLWGGSSIGFE